jgi:centrosomal CEP192-like protein/beta-propeller repeat-containing protein
MFVIASMAVSLIAVATVSDGFRRLSPHGSVSSGPSARRARPMLAFFEQNQGQANKNVRYLSRMGRSSVFLTDDAAIFSVNAEKHHKNGPSKDKYGAAKEQGEANSPAIVRLRLLGSSHQSDVSGLERLPGRVNYLIGDDPSKWHRDIPTFSRILYRQVYRGIDLTYYSSEKGLEYDFLVDPKADASRIRFAIDGSSSPIIDSAGNLRLETDAGEIAMLRPFAYQRNGEGARSIVPSTFVLASDRDQPGRHLLSISLGAYDNSRELVIDPQIVYSTYYGGSLTANGNPVTIGPLNADQLSFIPSKIASTFLTPYPPGDVAMDVTVDSAGMAYIAGVAYSIDLPSAFEGDNAKFDSSNQQSNAFIAKFDTSDAGNASLVYSTYLGGGGSDQAYGVAVDGSGDAFAVGQTTSGVGAAASFPGTSLCGAWGKTNNASSSSNPVGFVAKLNPAGDGLSYSCYINGSAGTTASRVALVPGCTSGCQAFVVGTTYSTAAEGFPVTSSPAPLQSDNNASPATLGNAYIVVVDGGTSPNEDYASFYGGSGNGVEGDSGVAIAVGASNMVAITGSTYSSTKLTTTSNAYQSSYSGGTSSAVCFNVKSTPPNDTSNAFVAEFDPTKSGSASLSFATYLGGTGAIASGTKAGDSGSALAFGSNNTIWVGGVTASCDIFPIAGVNSYQSGNQANANSGPPATAGFLAQFDTGPSKSGSNQLLYSSYLSGDGTLLDISSDSTPEIVGAGDGILDLSLLNGKIVMTGFAFSSSDFPLTTSACQNNNNGFLTSFVAEIDPTQSPASQLAFGSFLGGSMSNLGAGTGVDMGLGIAVNNSSSPTENDIFVAGLTYSVDFPVTPNAFQLTSKVDSSIDSTNAFLTVLDPSSTVCPTPFVTPTPTSTPTVSATATQTPSPTASATATGTKTPTPTATATATVTVTATPTSTATATPTKTATATVTATSTATATPTATATATATPTPTPTPVGMVSVSPSSLNFGTKTSVGKTSKPKKITIKNDGAKKTGMPVMVEVESASPSVFAVKSQCRKTLSPGKSCKVSVTFKPVDDTTAETGSLTIFDSAAGSPQSVELSGMGKTPKKK